MKANYLAALLTVFLIVAVHPRSGQTAKPAPPTVVKLFFILENGNGKFGKKIGCGDSVVPVVVKIAPTATPMREAFVQLLAVKDEQYCQTGLWNSLFQSSLSVQAVSISNGTAIIKLTGEYKDNGQCDTPRAEAQLVETAKQFPNVKNVKIFVNGEEQTFDPTE
jgi:spore germination protein GerM